nr:hypothetical protein GCM10020093_012200 [Planobispora longispora]
MLRLARAYVSTDDSAQEVVQDAWLAVVEGIDGFEGRSSLKTWVHRILINTAKKRGVRENRAIPWSSAFERRGEPSDGSSRPSRSPARTASRPAPGRTSPRSGRRRRTRRSPRRCEARSPRPSPACPTGSES